MYARYHGHTASIGSEHPDTAAIDRGHDLGTGQRPACHSVGDTPRYVCRCRLKGEQHPARSVKPLLGHSCLVRGRRNSSHSHLSPCEKYIAPHTARQLVDPDRAASPGTASGLYRHGCKKTVIVKKPGVISERYIHIFHRGAFFVKHLYHHLSFAAYKQRQQQKQ